MQARLRAWTTAVGESACCDGDLRRPQNRIRPLRVSARGGSDASRKSVVLPACKLLKRSPRLLSPGRSGAVVVLREAKHPCSCKAGHTTGAAGVGLRCIGWSTAHLPECCAHAIQGCLTGPCNAYLLNMETNRYGSGASCRMHSNHPRLVLPLCERCGIDCLKVRTGRQRASTSAAGNSDIREAYARGSLTHYVDVKRLRSRWTAALAARGRQYSLLQQSPATN